jgi:hypothetical protein
MQIVLVFLILVDVQLSSPEIDLFRGYDSVVGSVVY